MNTRVEEVRIDLGHIELAAHLYGPEHGQPVIALHGWLDNANSFARLAPQLQGLRIVALDLAGHGHSGHRPPGTGYSLPDYVQDVLQVARQLGWQRFSLLGHSLGAIIAVLLAGAVPDKVTRLALIDGLLPLTDEATDAPARLGEALLAQLALADKKKPVYGDCERAVLARMSGRLAVSREAAELLAQRGLMPVPGGYTWRSDSRLTLPTPVRFTLPQAMAFVRRLSCPGLLVVAEGGLLAPRLEQLDGLPLEVCQLPGGHHLHLDDEVGACAVAHCFNRLFADS
ncbi:alpha/beta hydrolase [Pseudomonas sp. DTU_2021_1001937_2_SI_NGA_ILE_001]|uniref:alpha/beta hydrolase n=1 Tax=Pseudomonas sp. DTU_2021_1001937_2_SI_NGA_ILE_001 TaxID=3077589 RepID=UPI0028FC2751|nr:alpha/beta hydrolase [Pseudomonas sp. DTU_2021_1001937_2_SI_NGA_ILE_001]WNW10773.1 alpha/beta hydrolase [Pseudomonas sp. DTU_2021_1001937_2_SI_NGA_ILE_001]